MDNPERTQIPEHHAKTKLTANGIRLTFVNVWDVSGGSHTWSQWEDPVRESRYVFFLVDARMLAGHDVGPRRDWQRLEDDAGQVARWMKEGNAWLCILTVTHIDEDPRLEQLGKEPYWDTVTDQLQPVVHRLGGDSVVRIVIGSLKDQAGADKVTDDLMKHVINREKKN